MYYIFSTFVLKSEIQISDKILLRTILIKCYYEDFDVGDHFRKKKKKKRKKFLFQTSYSELRHMECYFATDFAIFFNFAKYTQLLLHNCT